MSNPTCHACSAALDPDDNFCRRCGVEAGHAALPVVRPNATPAVWRPASMPPVVKGAAVMAAGTVGQFVLRRMVGNLLSGGRTRKTRALRLGSSRDDGMMDEAQIITETVMMRRVRVRRRPDPL